MKYSFYVCSTKANNMKKHITLTVVNTEANIYHFLKACEANGLTANLVSPKNEGIAEMSVQYNHDAELFILGQHYQLMKGANLNNIS